MTQPTPKNKVGMKRRSDTENVIVHARGTMVRVVEFMHGMPGEARLLASIDECTAWLDTHGHIHFYKSIKQSEWKVCGCGARVTLEGQIEYAKLHRRRL